MDENGNPVERIPRAEGESSYGEEDYDDEEGEEGEEGEEESDDEEGSNDDDVNLGKRGAPGNGHSEPDSKRQK